MPNDCNNSLTITGITHEQWHALAATFQVRGESYQQDFLKTFFPEPDWLTIPNENGEYPSASEDNDILSFSDGTQDMRWYEWRMKHWGTKWDVYSCCNDWETELPSTEFSASFCTAWSPLGEAFMARLSTHFPDALLTNYYDETGDDFYGVTIAKNGIVRDLHTTLSEHREAFLRQEFPDLDNLIDTEDFDGDDALCDFFWENCELGDFFDFINSILAPQLAVLIRDLEHASSQVDQLGDPLYPQYSAACSPA